MSTETIQEAIHWHEGLPPNDNMVVVARSRGDWAAAWYDFSAGRWRDVKYQILGDVTHWAEIRGPQ
jgi:hypothetical protein